MSELWTPVDRPPQLSEEALGTVSSRLLTKGVWKTSVSANALLKDSEQLLANHLVDLGNELNPDPSDSWHIKLIGVGASLTWLGYRETGYYHNIDAAFEDARTLAALDGVPSAYISSIGSDDFMFTLIDIASEAKEFKDLNQRRLKEAMVIGAGCVRFFFEQAIVLA